MGMVTQLEEILSYKFCPDIRRVLVQVLNEIKNHKIKMVGERGFAQHSPGALRTINLSISK